MKSEPKIHIDVETQYLPGRSNPSKGFFFYAYQITITNQGERPCQLISRHWIITDSDGGEEEVQGPGVVGEQPLIKPGDSFTYSSGCPLHTKVGAMRGFYHMEDQDGTAFKVEIPPFALTQQEYLN